MFLWCASLVPPPISSSVLSRHSRSTWRAASPGRGVGGEGGGATAEVDEGGGGAARWYGAGGWGVG